MRVFIIDGHVVFREGLKSVLGWEFDVVGETASARSAFSLLDLARPDVVVADLMLSGCGAKSLTAELKRRMPLAEVVILAPHAIVQDFIDGFAAGALGYVLKSEPIDAVAKALRRVARGQRYVTPSLEHIFMRWQRAGFPASALGVLSPRERHVFRLVTEGRDTGEMAAHFGVSRKTIETHKYRIMKKLGLASTAELVRFAALQGLMPFARPAAEAQAEAEDTSALSRVLLGSATDTLAE